MGARTMYAVLEETARTFGNAPALHQPTGKGNYQTYTWLEYKRAAEEIACGLRQLGIGKGDTVALHSETRAEFYLADLGVLTNGSIAAALYTTYPFADQAKNVRASHAKAVFMEDPKSMQALMDAAGPRSARRIALDSADRRSRGRPHAGATANQRARRAEERSAGLRENSRAKCARKIRRFCISPPAPPANRKWAWLATRRSPSNIDMGPQVLPLTHADSTIAFLPSAHIAQRVVIEFLPIRIGFPVWFSESLAKLPHEMKTIRPTFLLAPPRVWERIFASINTEVKKKSAAARKMFHGAVGLGAEVSRLREEGKPVPRTMLAMLKIADRLVFSKIRARLGGRIEVAASGAAPLGKDLARFYAAIGMPLIEGYGLTEGGVVCFNPVDRPKSGSIGIRMPGVELRLAEDGELLVKSPTLFSGYPNDPEATDSPCCAMAGCTPATSPNSMPTATSTSRAARKN